MFQCSTNSMVQENHSKPSSINFLSMLEKYLGTTGMCAHLNFNPHRRAFLDPPTLRSCDCWKDTWIDKLDLITVYVFNEHPPTVYDIVSSLCLCLEGRFFANPIYYRKRCILSFILGQTGQFALWTSSDRGDGGD